MRGVNGRFALALAAATLVASVACIAAPAQATDPQPDADFLFVGSFHMNNPGRDVHNTHADDVLSAKRQREIAEVARLIARFKPTKIMVEADTTSQAKLDQSFAQSCQGKRPLTRNETEQLGFRIACDQKLKGVVAVDWNDMGPIKDEASVDFPAAIERHGQQAQYERDKAIGKAVNDVDQHTLDTGTIGDMLLRLNSPEWLRANAQAYFRIGLYGTEEDAIGRNWDMLWYGRNLTIFNNIVRRTEPGDRVLVLYGAGHGNWLRQLATDSGKYRVEDTQRWLKDDAPTQ
ncbi:hypothetical protein LYSHEL_01150 [Lysobacter helvus]|uniref:Uncharacterized protein n=2 Tax=Lysobacteraceae TaxID=32033 RepID=A0ABM7Q1K7_9GAMM|nr:MULTISPECIES: DUF5694 domain-containing protein [Lysobacter]BCT91091.1 hypothetical protein LYSCAS_01150 [Lysobacter caseinilyticus]BCT94244.1 hypothetical protein LYSHEL_01150 [Lysobacter helvus]